MTDQERINENLQRQIDAQNARIDNVSINVNSLIRELKDFKDEMREQNKMRADEIKELRQKQDADMKEIRTSISNMQNNISDMGKHVRNMAITSMAAIGAMVVTVIISILNR